MFIIPKSITRVLRPAKLGYMRLCFQVAVLFIVFGDPFQHHIHDDFSIGFVFLKGTLPFPTPCADRVILKPTAVVAYPLST